MNFPGPSVPNGRGCGLARNPAEPMKRLTLPNNGLVKLLALALL